MANLEDIVNALNKIHDKLGGDSGNATPPQRMGNGLAPNKAEKGKGDLTPESLQSVISGAFSRIPVLGGILQHLQSLNVNMRAMTAFDAGRNKTSDNFLQKYYKNLAQTMAANPGAIPVEAGYSRKTGRMTHLPSLNKDGTPLRPDTVAKWYAKHNPMPSFDKGDAWHFDRDKKVPEIFKHLDPAFRQKHKIDDWSLARADAAKRNMATTKLPFSEWRKTLNPMGAIDKDSTLWQKHSAPFKQLGAFKRLLSGKENDNASKFGPAGSAVLEGEKKAAFSTVMMAGRVLVGGTIAVGGALLGLGVLITRVNRGISGYSGLMAASFAFSDVRDMFRDMSSAQRRAPAQHAWNQAFSNLKDKWQPVMDHILNLFLNLATIVAKLVDLLGDLTLFVPNIVDWVFDHTVNRLLPANWGKAPPGFGNQGWDAEKNRKGQGEFGSSYFNAYGNNVKFKGFNNIEKTVKDAITAINELNKAINDKAGANNISAVPVAAFMAGVATHNFTIKKDRNFAAQRLIWENYTKLR